MTQTIESFEKNVNDFLNHFEQFEYITTSRGFTTIESIELFNVFIIQHKYMEIK